MVKRHILKAFTSKSIAKPQCVGVQTLSLKRCRLKFGVINARTQFLGGEMVTCTSCPILFSSRTPMVRLWS
eukprot:1505399-Amphidinium_carterae.1